MSPGPKWLTHQFPWPAGSGVLKQKQTPRVAPLAPAWCILSQAQVMDQVRPRVRGQETIELFLIRFQFSIPAPRNQDDPEVDDWRRPARPQW